MFFLIAKLIYLLTEKHLSPDAVIALTFTNRAAEEMRSRVKSQIDNLPFIGTIHAWCVDFLIKHHPEWSEHAPKILSEIEQRELITPIKPKGYKIKNKI